MQAELHRVPLDSLVLALLDLGLADPRRFPFLERPPVQHVEAAIAHLKEQAALTPSEQITPLGIFGYFALQLIHYESE